VGSTAKPDPLPGAVRRAGGLTLAAALILATGCPTGGPPVDDIWPRIHDEIGSLVTVSWTQLEEAQGYVEYRWDDAWHQTPTATLAAGEQEVLLLGIPFERSVEYRLVNDLGDGPLATGVGVFETDPLPDGMPEPEVREADPTRWEPTCPYLLGSLNEHKGGWEGGDFWKFIIDRDGEVVWALLTPESHWSIYLRASRDGRDILWDESTFWSGFDFGQASRVHRMKIDGTVVESVATPGLHHAFTELADGSLVWGSGLQGDYETLERRDPSGEQRTIWDCETFYADHAIEPEFQSYACNSNGLFWHEPDDTFLYSFWTNSFVVEVDHATGDTLHIWGPVHDSWAFDPPEATLRFPHGPTYTDDGTFLISTQRSDFPDEGVVREFALDEAHETLREIWSFGTGEGIPVDSAGEAHRLPGGNTLHNAGTTAQVREITPGGDVVWTVDFNGPRLLGRTICLEDLYAFLP